MECKSGDYTAAVPPVPIPNTEVKYGKADGSRKARVGSPHFCIREHGSMSWKGYGSRHQCSLFSSLAKEKGKSIIQ